MANTFKVVTKAGVTSADVIYTVASSTTTVVLGIMVGNTTTSQITATVSLGSDTSNRAGANDEANQTVELVTNAPIPVGGTLELLSGNKVVMETTDTLSLTASGAADIALSIMEITQNGIRWYTYRYNQSVSVFTRKRFDGDGSTTAFTLDIAPSSVFDIEVFVENVRQDPNSAYGISGTTLTFTGAPPSGTNNIYVVHQAKAVGTINPTNDSVTASSIADDAVESEHLNNNIISGQTELAATPADTDEFLISDAGTIKRIDFSHIKVANTPAWFAALPAGGQSVANGSGTKMALTREDLDTDSAYDNSTNYRFTVPSGQGGKYFITVAAGQVGWSSVRFEAQLHKNGSSIFLCENNTSGTSYASTNGSCILTLSAGDYLELYVYHNNGSTQTVRGSNSEAITFFGGYKLIGV